MGYDLDGRSKAAASNSYDDEGNRIRCTEIATGAVVEYVWDHRNRLIEVVEKNSSGVVEQRAEYAYDPGNHRIARTVYAASGSGVETVTVDERYLYDGDQQLAVFDPSGTVTTTYLAVGYTIYAQHRSGRATEWLLADQLGSTRQVRDSWGTLIASYKYDAYGNLTVIAGEAAATTFLYTGLAYDPETGNFYAYHRFYDPTTGRWLSLDWIEDNLNNFYGYVANGPTNAVDPTGFKANEIVAAERPVALSRNEAGARQWGGVVGFIPTVYVPLSFRDNPSAVNPYRAVGPADETGVGRYYPEVGVVEYQSGNTFYRTSLAKLQDEANTDRPLTDRLTGKYWDEWFRKNNDDTLRPSSAVLGEQWIGILDEGFHDRVHQFENGATLLCDIYMAYLDIVSGLAAPGSTFKVAQLASKIKGPSSVDAVKELHKAVAQHRANKIMAAQHAARPVPMVAMKAPEWPAGTVSESQFLGAAEAWLGKDYKPLPNGRYLSNDGLRQVRFGPHEVKGPGIHGHFEAYDIPHGKGGVVIETSTVNIIPD